MAMATPITKAIDAITAWATLAADYWTTKPPHDPQPCIICGQPTENDPFYCPDHNPNRTEQWNP